MVVNGLLATTEDAYQWYYKLNMDVCASARRSTTGAENTAE